VICKLKILNGKQIGVSYIVNKNQKNTIGNNKRSTIYIDDISISKNAGVIYSTENKVEIIFKGKEVFKINDINCDSNKMYNLQHNDIVTIGSVNIGISFIDSSGNFVFNNSIDKIRDERNNIERNDIIWKSLVISLIILSMSFVMWVIIDINKNIIETMTYDGGIFKSSNNQRLKCMNFLVDSCDLIIKDTKGVKFYKCKYVTYKCEVIENEGK